MVGKINKNRSEESAKAAWRRHKLGYHNQAEYLATGVQEYLQDEEAGGIELDGESARDLTQERLAEFLDVQTSRKKFRLSLPRLGPYQAHYSATGTRLLLAGAKGHLSAVAVNTFREEGHVHLNELVRHATWLHDDNFFAVAQRTYLYLYNRQCAEVHKFLGHDHPMRLEFLPRHFLLASIGRTANLCYQDTSTGKLVAKVATKLFKPHAMAQDRSNGVVVLGDSYGDVTLWSPAYKEYLVKLKAHHAPLDAGGLAVSQSGTHLVTAGSDGWVKVWDLRTYQLLNEIRVKANHVALSQRGVLATATDHRVQFYRDYDHVDASAFMLHDEGYKSEITSIAYQPWEDIMGLGLSDGFQSIVVPGTGEPNVDSFLPNPYETKAERMERPVRMLLDKLGPETIILDQATIGGVDRAKTRADEKEKKLTLPKLTGLKQKKTERKLSERERKAQLHRVMRMAKKDSLKKAKVKKHIHGRRHRLKSLQKNVKRRQLSVDRLKKIRAGVTTAEEK